MKVSEIEHIHEILEENAVYELNGFTYTQAMFLKDLLEDFLSKKAYTYEDREKDIEVII